MGINRIIVVSVVYNDCLAKSVDPTGMNDSTSVQAAHAISRL
jgi:hypothetical protein